MLPADLLKNPFEFDGRVSTEAFFQPVRNCDSVRHADRFSLLIDGSDYFRVLRDANTRASGASCFHLHLAMTDNDPWPPRAMDLDNADTVMSLTDLAFADRPVIHKIRQQYLDAIPRATRRIYIEPVFHGGSIGGALHEKLDGPDLDIVAPRKQSGWLQEMTMGALHGSLTQADVHDRCHMT
ncbi:hypothetical protein SBC1_68650 (plasmid) [Caballeronia sp. SBC1]|nr:hypothetical protein SBC2_68390 [Caballeronia sp. SBC2]QIN66818.1 hypothetical protein SBC1_68650 [Caballeronia sp. SBC1]